MFSFFYFCASGFSGQLTAHSQRIHRAGQRPEMLLKALFSLMEQLQLQKLMIISFVLLWIGGLLINVTMALVAGAELHYLT